MPQPITSRAVIPAIVYLSALGSGETHGASVSALSLAAVVGLIVAARFLLRPILRFVADTGIHELFIAASLAIVCGAALAMYHAGLSMGLGAFVAGMLVADSEYRHQLETDVMPFKGLLLGLFFIAVGMSADLSLLVRREDVDDPVDRLRRRVGVQRRVNTPSKFQTLSSYATMRDRLPVGGMTSIRFRALTAGVS